MSLCRQKLRIYSILALFVIFCPISGLTETTSPLIRPEESITYWKTFEISIDEDPMVKEAAQVFERLLLGWEETRIAPELHVVRSDKGPWAASLDDGTILLSREAIDVCWKAEKRGGHDRLAFVLAHELAHQRADHLWHRRFFRLAGQQPPQVKGRMLGGIGIDQLEIEDIEAKEIQADREGLLMMAMVGFDPQKVAGDDSRFFEEWIESIWGQPCGKGANAGDCAKARARFERARAHWLDTANQAVLFDLGIQAYVAGEYAAARQYFMVYGRQFPSREIHNNIGLTYIEEALALRKKLQSKGEDLGPNFVYPYFLEEVSVDVTPPKGRSRGDEGAARGVDPEVNIWRKEMEKALSDAAESFDRALKIDPAHRPSYWNLAATHLLAGNAPLAYGVLAGIYTKRFGQDAFAGMLLGIAAYLDDNPKKAGALLNKAATEATAELITLARMNLAVYYRATGDSEGERAEWKRLADWGRKNGDEGLFRLSLKRMGKEADPTAPPGLPAVEKIHGYTLSERVPAALPQALKTVGNEVWIEGERIQIYRFEDGSRMAVNAGQQIISLWQGEGEAASSAGVRIGDDAAKLNRLYGIPARKIQTIQGEYRVYERPKIVFKVNKNRVGGWFLYTSEQ